MNFAIFRRAAPLALSVTTAVSGLWSSSVLACSTCKCGDYTISLFGVEKPFESRFRVAVEHVYRSEVHGEGSPAGITRKTDEHRTLLGVAYSFNEDLSLAVQLPYVQKEIVDNTLARQEARGIGDLDVVGRWVLHRGGEGSGKHLAGMRVGVRLPTGESVKDANGALIDIDAQPDAGSTVPNIGGWYGFFQFPWAVNAAVTYYRFGKGDQGFAPGDAVVASFVSQYALTQTLALQAGVDARYAGKNRFSGASDADSGGTLAMVSVGAAWRMLDEVIVNAGVQLPVLDELNGYQEEKPAFRVGIAVDL